MYCTIVKHCGQVMAYLCRKYLYTFIYIHGTTFNLLTRLGNSKRITRGRIIFRPIFIYVIPTGGETPYIKYTHRRVHANMCKISGRNGASGTGIRCPREDHITVHYRARCGCSLVGRINAAGSTAIGRRNAALYHFAAMAMYSLGRVVPSAVGGTTCTTVCIWSALCTQRCTGCECNKRPIRSVLLKLWLTHTGRTSSQGMRFASFKTRKKKRKHFSYTSRRFSQEWKK